MKDIILLYKSGKLKEMTTDEVNLIWIQIKKESPSLIKYLNDLNNGKLFSEYSLISFKEKIDIYSKIVNRLCKFNLRKEVSYFDKEINIFCDGIKKNMDKELVFQILALTNEYVLIKNHKIVFKTKGISLFHVICRILMTKETDLSTFMFYLAIKDQKNSEFFLKQLWTNHLYILSKKV